MKVFVTQIPFLTYKDLTTKILNPKLNYYEIENFNLYDLRKRHGQPNSGSVLCLQ
jgi:hypothetical protein